MPRVLHINDYPIDAGGGAEVVMRQMVVLLRQGGVNVETFTCADLPDPRRTPLRYLHNTMARRALAERLANFQPDVVHLHNWYHVLSPGILVALADHKNAHPMRVVMTAHDYHLACPNAGGCWFRRLTGQREPIAPGSSSLGKLLGRRWDERSEFHSLLKVAQHAWNYRWHDRQRVIDMVLCPSRFVQTMLAPTSLPTCWLPHPVPTLPVNRSQPTRGERLRFVFAGRIEPEKGLDEFLHLLPDGFDEELLIIGAGSDRARCEATGKARKWPLRIEFAGRLPHSETLARLAECHVLVQPSRVLETYGLTLIEALAVGTNLLVTDRGAAREIVDDSGIGFLFHVDDRASLVEQLARIRRQHADGSLNRFASGPFLAARSEAAFVDQLLLHYGDAAARRSAA